ncbi:MAG: hypothetical protein A2Z91_03700 [Deltaproteobacteria bacterium GWA2_38_16]|nr:MAG: hypothetical protein A2Z91_03700 [Deltaproteobacteria bacterium GWA2_38_16]OGQ02137.1 MAG: hypothetical protein A3D19_00420 [Deltaproteobacteria bacterium RIFCSPHIGHO2_02_FULL_38_15]OGQ34189.1 MAG: hypothetical protein A3A72_02775 [Deltaproteobacteria bacterium RIFCSPLOWO2_01_FULL_38_9]OGQ60567.1 MAG: hypothetical protein A3G92_01600 [Deltaproteobacteria bacterium RIFCSPLOWO2_12_FULL_38_8]
MKKYLILLGVIGVFVGGIFYYQLSQITELVILHTNDHHGYCWSENGKGGFAKQMTILKNVRKKYKNALVLSAGDVNTGAPEADFNQGEPSFKGMNILGFDAMAIGNHDFDNSLPALRMQEQWSAFPFLSANIYDRKTQARLFKPYIVKEVGGIRVGILGLTTEETKVVTNVKYVKDIEFKDPILEAKKILPELEKKADILVALTHMGFYPDRAHSDNPYKGDIELASENPHIHFIIGGHSHILIPKPVEVGRTPIMQAYQYGKYMGELHIKINKKKQLIKGFSYVMHDLNEKVAEDSEMVAFLEPYLQKAKVYFDEKIGESMVDLMGERDVVRSQETNLGNLVTDLFRSVTKADVAIQNGGGIRASIPKGKVSFGDVRRAFPFNNTIVVLKLKGQEILELLNRSASLARPAGGFLQVAGLSFVIEGGQVKNVKVQGKSLQLEKVYSLATNDFVANGGDGYELLKNKPRQDTGFVISSALKNYIISKKVIAPKIEKRIVVK